MDSASSSYCYILQHWVREGCLTIDICLCASVLNFSFITRTLLALGCHVAQVNVHAEDDLKRIKLPKE